MRTPSVLSTKPVSAGSTARISGSGADAGWMPAIKSRISRLTLTGSRAWGKCPDPSRTARRTVREIGEPCTGCTRSHDVVTAVDHQRSDSRSATGAQVRRPRHGALAQLGGDQRLGSVSRPQPTPSSICFVECGSVKHCEKKNSRKSSKCVASNGCFTWPSLHRSSRGSLNSWIALSAAWPANGRPVR